MNAGMMRLITKIGKKKENFINKYKHWRLKKKILRGIRNSAKNGNYSHSEDIEYIWSAKRVDDIIDFLENKGYNAESRTGSNFFGLVTVVEIEWGSESNE